MKNWDYAIKNIVKNDTRSSFATRANREQMLAQVGTQLRELGYKIDSPRQLKPKHVTALIKTWQNEGKPESTIKNRLANLRWLVARPDVAKQNVIPRTNAELGVGNRVYLDNSKQRAFQLTQDRLDAIKSEMIKASLLLQKEFGLRREESLKIRPWSADNGETLHLQASWCKGGRERDISIKTESQRAAIDNAKRVTEQNNGRRGSLIPNDKSYVEHKRLYERETLKAGIDGHGVRHQYAQDRYKALTGLDCPKAGGPTWKDLTLEQRVSVKSAKLEIAVELGHGREIIANNYLGK